MPRSLRTASKERNGFKGRLAFGSISSHQHSTMLQSPAAAPASGAAAQFAGGPISAKQHTKSSRRAASCLPGWLVGAAAASAAATISPCPLVMNRLFSEFRHHTYRMGSKDAWPARRGGVAEAA